MFYKESIIKNILKCQLCKRPLDGYDPPRILPCNKTICHACSTEIIAKTHHGSNSTFKCSICSHEHEIPANGFIINEMIAMFIRIEPAEIFRSKNCTELKSKLNRMELILKNIDYNFTNVSDFIKEHCNEQTRIAQLKKEEDELKIENNNKSKKIKLNKSFDSVIDEINEYENECISSTSGIVKTNLEKNETIKQAKQFVEQKLNYLEEYEINETKIINYIQESIEFISKLEKEIENFKTVLFNNRLIKFNSDENCIEYEAFKLVTRFLLLLFSYINLI